MDSSPFTITHTEASSLVRLQNQCQEDNRHCYMLQVAFSPIYGVGPLPQSSYKKLPRLINRIPFGAGKLSQSEAASIQWRYLEGSGRDFYTFISLPMSKEDAELSKCAFREGLVTHSKAVFGDITVKTSLILTRCVEFDSDMFVNDIAVTMAEGLHFRD